MSKVDLGQPPEKPICWNVDRSGPCRFATICSERRQRIAAAVIVSAYGEVVREDLASRGEACVWFQQLRELAEAGRLAQPPVATS